MIRQNGILLAAAGLALLAGCSASLPGTSRSLGEVDYAAAFAAGREVMAQYFSVESADPDKGVIRSRPKAVDAPPERLVGASPARQVATMRIRKEGGAVVAHATVDVQRMGSEILRQPRPGADDYDSVPNKTPAEVDAATTVAQNESWRTVRHATDVERKMLMDLFRSLHPAKSP